MAIPGSDDRAQQRRRSPAVPAGAGPISPRSRRPGRISKGRGQFAEFSPESLEAFLDGAFVDGMTAASGSPATPKTRPACTKAALAHNAWEGLPGCAARPGCWAAGAAAPSRRRAGARSSPSLPLGEMNVMPSLGHFGPFEAPRDNSRRHSQAGRPDPEVCARPVHRDEAPRLVTGPTTRSPGLVSLVLMSLPLPASLTPSKVTTFKECALAFRLSAIDKLPEPPSLQAFRGTVVHRALELLMWDERQGGRTLAVALPSSSAPSTSCSRARKEPPLAWPAPSWTSLSRGRT